MNFLEEKILNDADLRPGDIVKVDNFLNHLVDMDLEEKIADEIISRFSGKQITKVVTIEASGISLATAVAMKLHVPMAFAKKRHSLNMDDDCYVARAFSYTHKCLDQIALAKFCLSPDDKVLVVDDFLATGEAMRALCSIVKQSGATVAGCASAVEKGFQEGGNGFRAEGIQVESVAIIESIDYETGKIEFRKQ